MDLRTEQRYDADPQTVFAMFTDEAFLSRKAQATNALRHEGRWSGTAIGSRCDCCGDAARRARPRAGIRRRHHRPGADRRVEPASSDGSRTGSIRIIMGGLPVQLNGAMRLAPAPMGSQATIDAQIKAAIPLFGGKIEKAVHDALIQAVRIEESVGQAWLDGQRGTSSRAAARSASIRTPFPTTVIRPR